MKKEFIALTKNLAQSVTRCVAKKFGLGLALGCAGLFLNAPLRADDQVPFTGNFIPMILSTTPLDATHVLEIDVHFQATQLTRPAGRLGPSWT